MTSQDYRYIEPIRGLGTTWYDRGLAYWIRRVVLASTFLLLTLFGLGFTVGLLVVGWTSPSVPLAVKIGFTVIAAIAAGWAATRTERSYLRKKRGQKPKRHDRGKNRTLLSAALGLIGLARMTAFGLVVVALCLPITAGGMAIVFAHCLGREYGDEQNARLRLQTRQKAHGNPGKRRGRP